MDGTRAIGVAALIVASSLSWPSVAAAQEARDSAPKKTRYEKFASADGALLVTAFYELMPLPAKLGKAEASLIHCTNVQSGSDVKGLRFTYKSTKKYSRRVSSFLDEDEIHSLAKAIRYMKTSKEKVVADANTYTEVKYTSRSNFTVGFWVAKDKQVGVFAGIGGESVFLTSLAEFENVVEHAQAKIGELGSSGKGTSTEQ